MEACCERSIALTPGVHLSRRRQFLTALLLGVTAACGTTSPQQNAPERVDALVTWIERVHVEADRGKLALADSFERLNAVAAGKLGKDAVMTAFARFVQSIDTAEQQSKRFGETVGPMQEAARPVFQQWEADVATIGSERLQKLGATRLAIAKERYAAIVAAAVPAQQQMAEYVKTLRDHAAFLAHDLNPSAIAAIQGEVKALAKTAQALDRGLDTCLNAARSYVEQSSLPAAPPAGASGR